MSDEIKVKPTPIQRNVLDVAMELTQLYYECVTPKGVEEIQETFSKFYTTAATCEACPGWKLIDQASPNIIDAYKKQR